MAKNQVSCGASAGALFVVTLVGIGLKRVFYYACNMVTKIYSCPHCGQSQGVVRHGFTRWGSQRLRCNVCHKAWTPDPKKRNLSEEKEALIVKALGERLSQRAVARTFGISRDTVRDLLKKSLTPLA